MCLTPVVTTYCAKIKTEITGNNLNTVFMWYCTSIGQLHSRRETLVALVWFSRHDQMDVSVCVCVCTSYIRSAPQCQCFIWLEIFNESADKRVVFLCSLLRAVFTDTHPHPAVLLKLAPAAATLRISQGVQFHVWVACWWIFYSKTILIFYSKTISKAYLKDCFWFPRRTLEPSRIFWLSAQLKHLILEEGYQNYACGWLLKMTWVGRPKSPLPQRERTSVDIHTTHKMMLQSWLWAMLVYLWCTGIQDINNITISKSSGKFKPLRNNSEETAETNVQ